MDPDRALIDYVNQVINSGSRRIQLPGLLLRDASAEAITSARQMCQLAGVSISVATDEFGSRSDQLTGGEKHGYEA